MHGVIEATGGDIHVIDLGSTRGTTVNGERITKARLQSGDEIMFGDCRVIVTFGDVQQQATPAPQAWGGGQAAARRLRAAVRPPATPLRLPSRQYAPQPSYAAPSYSAPSFAGAPGAGAEVEVHDGSRAMEVQTIFRGVVTGTRHLYNPEGKTTHAPGDVDALRRSRRRGGGPGSVRRDRPRRRPREGGVREAHGRRQGSEDLHLEGPLAGQRRHRVGRPARRRGRSRTWASSAAARPTPNFIIGSDADVDAPVSPEFSPSSSHQLVSATGADYVVNVTPRMTGEVYVDGQSYQLQQFIQQRGASFSLSQGSSARLDCGETTFVVTATPRPRTLDVPFLTWRWDEQVYTVGSAVALGLFLLMIFSVPPDPKSLSLDLFNSDNRFVKFLIKPPEEKEEEIPGVAEARRTTQQGGKGKRHKGEEGKMGKKTSKNKEGLYGLKGPKDNPDPHLAKKLAEEQAKNAGILGVLKQTEGSHIASIFGRDTALGNDAADVLGGLIGNQIGEAYGVGGLGLVGTGSGGGGTGEGTIGLGNLGTIGKGGGGGNGSGYGRGAGGLGGRRAKAPDVIPGQANVRGSLDKEIIRRIIRRHINEVKYCYEQELTKKPDLGGRIMVQFTIAASGQVIASVLQNSTMGNARVENCTVQAVRRWEFPKPLGGGIVIVSYPFVLTPAGGGE